MIQSAAVIGSGAMGSQIAMVCALAGVKVVLNDIEQESLDTAKRNLQSLMKRRIKKGKLSEQDVKQAFQNITFTINFDDAVHGADIVIEAIIENLEAKISLFKRLEEKVSSETILATNSSTIVSSKLANFMEKPERVCNMHFFNPALVMDLVEVVKGEHTSAATANHVVDFSKRIGKTPILIKKEVQGFVVNRILNAINDEALWLYENGIADFKDIDLGCKKGLNHPIGPFELLDLTGIDVNYHIKEIMYKETNDEKDKPSRTLEQKYKENKLGRKTGEGFYTYE